MKSQVTGPRASALQVLRVFCSEIQVPGASGPVRVGLGFRGLGFKV